MEGHSDRSERTCETASSCGIGQNSGECTFSALPSLFAAAKRDDLRDTRRRLRWRSRPYLGRNENPTLQHCFVKGQEPGKRRPAKNLPLYANYRKSYQERVHCFHCNGLS